MSSSNESSKSKRNREIRILQEDDLQIFLELRLRGLQESPESFGADHTEWLALPISEVAQRMASDGDGFVLGAFEESPVTNFDLAEVKASKSTLIGIAGFRRQKPIKVRHTGSIWGVYVDVPYRGKGVGKALMLDTIARARMMDGLEKLILTATAHNQSALTLYENLQFTAFGRDQNALKIDGRYFDEIMMVLDLRQKLQNP